MTLALVPYHKPYERVIHEVQGLPCDVPASRAMTLALVPYHKPYERVIHEGPWTVV